MFSPAFTNRNYTMCLEIIHFFIHTNGILKWLPSSHTCSLSGGDLSSQRAHWPIRSLSMTIKWYLTRDVCHLSAVAKVIRLHEYESHIRDDVKRRGRPLKHRFARIHANSTVEFSKNLQPRGSFHKAAVFKFVCLFQMKGQTAWKRTTFGGKRYIDTHTHEHKAWVSF